MEITEAKYTSNTVVGLYEDILWIQEHKPITDHLIKEWRKDLLQKYKKYNELVEFDCFCETKVDL